MLTKENLKDIYPLSYMQEGMLFHALYDEGSLAYCYQYGQRVFEELDIKILEDSWNELLKRYDTLRTVFVYKNVPEPLQVVLKEQKVDFYFEDLRQSGITEPSEQDSYIKEYKKRIRGRGFDLSKDVLIRVSVIQMEKAVFETILTYHHILMDGWSLQVAMKDLFEIYAGIQQGVRPDLPRVMPYKNYINWLKSKDREQAKQYWAGCLKGYAREATLAGRLSHTGEYISKELQFELDEQLTSDLNQLAVKNQVTINTVVQGIWGILLGKYNNTDDVVFGVVVSGRPEETDGIEQMVGLFINTVPVRIQMNPDAKFNEHLRYIQEQALISQDYHYYPLADIQAGCSLKRKLLDHLIDILNFPFDGELKEEELKAEKGMKTVNTDAFQQTSYDLNVVVGIRKKMEIHFLFNARVYNETFLNEVVDNFTKIARDVIAGDSVRLSDIKMLSEEDKDRIEAKKEESERMNKELVAEFDF